MWLRPVTCSVVVAATLTVGPTASAAPDVVDCTDTTSAGAPVAQSAVPSKPYAELGVPGAAARLAERGITPGDGVKVAVLDSGVDGTSPHAPIAVERPPSYDGVGGPVSYSHGTEVAGLVAGHPQAEDLPVGIAPGATIVDLPVYRSVPTTPTGAPARGIRVPDVVDALDWLVAHAREERIGVVVLALQLDDTPQLRRAVHELARPVHDVVIVAASGNRPAEGDPLAAQFPASARPGEDARDAIFPAGYADDVLAVSATAEGASSAGTTDAASTVLYNSATDVAAPTAGAVTVDATGSTCVIRDVQTSWATGEVAGVVALLRSAFPHDTAAQVVSRLKETADGRTDEHDRLAGAGTVQPLEALTRVLEISRSGRLEATTSQDPHVAPVRAPEPAADPLADVRHEGLWWGLLGGAALAVTALLRPLVRRRRTPLR